MCGILGRGRRSAGTTLRLNVAGGAVLLGLLVLCAHVVGGCGGSLPGTASTTTTGNGTVCRGYNCKPPQVPAGRHTALTANTANQALVNRWSKRTLTYQLSDSTVDPAQRAKLAQLYGAAVALWTENIPLAVRPAAAGETPDILVEFCGSPCERLDDGDTQFFGEAELPRDDRAVSELILQPDSFTDDPELNVLFCVMVHELGHSLGLNHSEDEHAVMARLLIWDEIAAAPVTLKPDDIHQIQRLYGNAEGTTTPATPTFPTPTDPNAFTPVVPEDRDSDRDGLSDAYERLVSHTDPNNPDSDTDGLSDAFEVQYGLDPSSNDSDQDGHLDADEILAGTPARPPVICDTPAEWANQNVALVAAGYFDEAGLTEGDVVWVHNHRTGDSVSGVVVHRVANGDCGVQLPEHLREALGIHQIHMPVPLAFCPTQTLFDFQTGIDPPIVRGSVATLVQRGGTTVLKVAWSLDTTPSDSWVVLVFSGIPIVPGDRIQADVEVEQPQTVRFEAKRPWTEAADETRSRTMLPGRVETIEIVVAKTYPLGEVAFVIERDMNYAFLRTGTFWVDNIRISRCR